MLVDNRRLIRSMLEDVLPKEEVGDGFFKFEALVRTKDDPENVFIQQHKGSFLVHSWVVKTVNQYDKYIDEMVKLCDLTGARLYVNLDQKSTEKLVIDLADSSMSLIKQMLRNNQISTKNTFNLLNSITSRGTTSIHDTRKYLFDVDSKDVKVLSQTLNLITANNSIERCMVVLDSPNGWHVVVDRFNIEDIREKLDLMEDVEVKDNALTVVYFNREEKVDEEYSK